MISFSSPVPQLDGMKYFWNPSTRNKWEAEVLDSYIFFLSLFSSKLGAQSFIALLSKQFSATCGLYCPNILPSVITVSTKTFVIPQSFSW